MKDLDKFLADLTDAELLVFAAYRYDDFLGNSKQKIKVEVNKRGITKKTFMAFADSNLQLDNNTDIRCPRCNSSRFIIETDMELRQSQYANYEKEVQSPRCQICNYNPAKTPNQSLLSSILISFGIKSLEKHVSPQINDAIFK